MAASKRLYEALAKGLKQWYMANDDQVTENAYHRLVVSIASDLAHDNPRFNTTRFHEACGL